MMNTYEEATLAEISTRYEAFLRSMEQNIASVDLPEDLIYGMARGNHTAWMKAKTADGWTLGEDNDSLKTSSLLVDFDSLPTDIREDNIRNAKEAVSLLIQHGVVLSTANDAVKATSEQLDAKISEIVEAVHDSWSYSKFMTGWKFGEITDKPNNIHRDLIPFANLMETHPEDAAYDFDTVKGAFKAAEDAGYVIVISI